MNKVRRDQLRKVIQKVEDIIKVIENILYDEQDAYDNIPDSLKESDRGNESIEAQGNMEAAIEALEQASLYLEEMC